MRDKQKANDHLAAAIKKLSVLVPKLKQSIEECKKNPNQQQKKVEEGKHVAEQKKTVEICNSTQKLNEDAEKKRGELKTLAKSLEGMLKTGACMMTEHVKGVIDAIEHADTAPQTPECA